MEEVVIVSACRTAISKFLGSLKDVPARDLAVTAGKEAVNQLKASAKLIQQLQYYFLNRGLALAQDLHHQL